MKVALNTNFGRIVLELDAVRAPKTVASFVEYVKSGHYSGVIFHRVIKDFMIQGGGFDKNMSQKPTNAPVQNEADNGLKNDKGTIAMAIPGTAINSLWVPTLEGRSSLRIIPLWALIREISRMHMPITLIKTAITR